MKFGDIDGEILELTFNDELQCSLSEMLCAFDKGLIILGFMYSHCCDMSGAIKYCERIMPHVTQIQTYNYRGQDTIYDKSSGKWKAY